MPFASSGLPERALMVLVVGVKDKGKWKNTKKIFLDPQEGAGQPETGEARVAACHLCPPPPPPPTINSDVLCSSGSNNL